MFYQLYILDPLWFSLRGVVHFGYICICCVFFRRAKKLCINSSPPSAAHMLRWTGSALIQVMAYSAPSHYLSQCSLIVNRILRNKFQWNSNGNTKFFIQDNAYENVACEIAAILSWERWVKGMGCVCRLCDVNRFRYLFYNDDVMTWKGFPNHRSFVPGGGGGGGGGLSVIGGLS